MIFAALLAVAPPAGQADVRARVAAEEEARQQRLKEISFPGFDVSDEAVIASSAHYCGVTAHCRSEFTAARNNLVRAAAYDNKQKGALKILNGVAEGRFTNWQLAYTLFQAKYHPPAPAYRPSATVTCRAYVSRSTYSSTCTSYGN